ncbi:MAG: sigma-70 family RNA polymerase sigma factor [Ruminococcus sp.]|nr:sigma-70 family RNA polymerase sigma factor [Ruminococcus sp.]
MTNEDLAIQIQLGHTEHYAELWNKVKRLMHKILYAKLSRIELPNYLDSEDIEQELYFALCNAVQAYDDTKPYKFTSYLEYQIMNAIRSVMPRKPLNEYSYNQTAGEDEDTELLEFIEDETAVLEMQDIELTDIQTQVRQAVAELPKRERSVINLYHFGGQSLSQIAENLSVSPQMVRSIKNKGLRILRQNKAIRGIYDEFQRHYTSSEWEYERFADSWKWSNERRCLMSELKQKQQNGEYLTYGQLQSILYIAKQRYIKIQTENLRNYKCACGVR